MASGYGNIAPMDYSPRLDHWVARNDWIALMNHCVELNHWVASNDWVASISHWVKSNHWVCLPLSLSLEGLVTCCFSASISHWVEFNHWVASGYGHIAPPPPNDSILVYKSILGDRRLRVGPTIEHLLSSWDSTNPASIIMLGR